jgi:hypothetical protein
MEDLCVYLRQLLPKPFAIAHSTICDAYVSVRDDRARLDEMARAVVVAAQCPLELLTAVLWIVPGGTADLDACLQLARLRDDFAPDEWRYATDARRPLSLFKRLAERLATKGRSPVFPPRPDPLALKSAPNHEENVTPFNHAFLPGRTVRPPANDRFVVPPLYAMSVQLLVYHTAVSKGTDVDQPRNVAKPVTLE